MATVEFAKDYTHLWPSRAETEYPKGFKGTVKAEVAERAGALGCLVGVAPSRLPDQEPVNPPLPPADDPDAITVEAPGAEGDAVPLNTRDTTPVSK